MDTYQQTLAALADPTRRAILELLRDGPLTVGELADEMPVSRPAVSQHLAVLRNAQLVSEERAGTRHLYSANAEGLAALRAYLEDVWGSILADFTAEAKKKRKRKR
ncbi:MAG TPA: metalloregulator ArsR/SmtB family transcription factor [Thermoanaerobaculia bacterium]|nr:metalloregulator ArsR/SmtB family transcription factor [Thermoanaerobaculia bacterium]